jgi:hypothetical protein
MIKQFAMVHHSLAKSLPSKEEAEAKDNDIVGRADEDDTLLLDVVQRCRTTSIRM